MKTVKLIQDAILNKIIPDCIDYDFVSYEHYGKDCVNVHHEYKDFVYIGDRVQESFINVTYLSNVSLALGSGSYPESLQAHFTSIEEDTYKDFLQEKGYDSDHILSESEKAEYCDGWDEYASECLDFFYTVRIFIENNSVKIISGTNTDFNYGRFNAGLVGTFEKDIPFESLTFELLEDTIQNAFMGI